MTFGRRDFLFGGALAMVGLAACGDPPRGRFTDRTAPGGTVGAGAEPSAIESVVMVGDSITEASIADLDAAFVSNGITDATIDGDKGRRIEVGNGKGGGPLSGVKTIYNRIAGGADPDAWVVELGTNDVGSYPTPEAYGALIDQILTMLPVERPLVWVNVYRPDHLDQTDVFNLVLAQRIADRGNAVVADWFTVASDPDQDILRSDDLHPNAKGSTTLALLVAQALRRF